MRRFTVVALAASLALVATGCPKKKKKDPVKGKGPGTAKAAKPKPKPKSPNALPADKAWASGKTKGVTLTVATALNVAGFTDTKGKDAPPTTAMTQTMHITDGRGVIVETTEKGVIPKGTEIRYNSATKKYVLADPAKKQYWAMTGSQLGSLQEGGPEVKRSNYTVAVQDTKEKAKIAGFDAVKSTVEIGFDVQYKDKNGVKSRKAKVKLAVWHTADAKLSDKWGDTLVSLMAFPFQDKAGQKVIEEVQKKIKFPLKWGMAFESDGKKEKGESFPKLVTSVSKAELKELDKAAFQWPPVNYKPAMGPYTFGEGGQTLGEGDLGKLPAKEGKKPAGVEPVDGKGAKKKG